MRGWTDDLVIRCLIDRLLCGRMKSVAEEMTATEKKTHPNEGLTGLAGRKMRGGKKSVNDKKKTT